MVAHKWRPIEPLPEPWRDLSDGDIEEIRRLWAKLQERLEGTGKLSDFLQQIRREWAIETGVIEGVYSIDKGVTESLIEQGIDAAYIPHGTTDKSPDFVAQVVLDQQDALEHIFALVKDDRALTVGFIRQLHAALVRNQDVYVVVDSAGKTFEKELEKGVFKVLPNNPRRHEDGEIHEYCSPEQTSSEMDNLIQFHAEHEARGVSADVAAAWLHHAFAQIHPFPDGNGRVARALASAVLIKDRLFPMTIAREVRVQYIDALERADGGDLRPFVGVLTGSLRRQLLRADRIARSFFPAQSVEDERKAAVERLVIAGKIPPVEWLKAKEHADKLHAFTNEFMTNIANRLHADLQPRDRSFSFAALSGTSVGLAAATEVASRLGVVLNQEQYQRIVRLTLRTTTKIEWTISFDAIGPSFRGVIGVFALQTTYTPAPDGTAREGMIAPDIPKFEVLAGSPFLIRFDAAYEILRPEFERWLEKVVGQAMRAWGGGV